MKVAAQQELIAQAIHDASDRSSGPFICLNSRCRRRSWKANCSAMRKVPSLVTDKKAGKFELADNGTLFLDEIGEMSPSIQAKFCEYLRTCVRASGR